MSRVGGSGRNYAPSDYDDREYTRSTRGGRTREYDEIDVDVRNRGSRAPDYLREDYGRPSNAGPMVLRERKSEDFRESTRSRPAPSRPGRDYYEEEDLVVRRGPEVSSPRSNHGTRGGRREEEREEVSVDVRRDSSRQPPARRRDQEREDISIDIREGSRQPAPRSRDYDNEIVFRRGEGDRRRRDRGAEEEDIVIRRDEVDQSRSRRGEQVKTNIDIDIHEEEPRRPPPPRPRPRDSEEIDINIKRNESERLRPDRARDETLVIRERSRSRGPPGRPIAREREEFTWRRRSPSPPPQRETEEIIIRQTKSPSPSSSPSPPPLPPPAPDPITRPPIVQEVITHHRHIDHGFERAPSSSSSSPSPPPRRHNSGLEVDIRRKDAKGNVTEEDIKVFDGRDDRGEHRRDRAVSRRRSVESFKSQALAPIPAPTPPQRTRENINIDINVDNNDRQVALAPKPRPREMWTEVTKDLVSREAIQQSGYQFEETEDFFYVMEYLRYEDVMRLVEVSEDLHRDRRDRIGQIQWERQDPRLPDTRPPPPRPSYPPPPPRRRGGPWDEEIYEREVFYEDRPRRGYR